MKTLLVVDDNQDILEAVRLLMRKSVDEVVTSSTPDSIPMLLRKHKPQVVLLDMNFRAVVNTGNEGLFWLQEIRRLSPQTSVVLFTAYADVKLAVEGMKLGAVDFVVKPFENSVLMEVLKGHSVIRVCREVRLLPTCYGDHRSLWFRSVRLWIGWRLLTPIY